MRILWAFVILLAAFGCASNGTKTDFTTLLNTAYTLDDGLLVTADNLLTSGVINAQQAKRLLAIADQTKESLDTAKRVYDAGNAALAQSTLNQATGTLSLANSCSKAADAGLTLDACLDKGVVTP